MDIRPATGDDIAALAHIHVEGWKAAYDGLADAAYLQALSEADFAEDWQRWIRDGDMAAGGMHVRLATIEGQAAGFVSYGRLRTPPPGMSPIRPLYSAEIYALYVLPACWRQGIGRALMAAAAADLQQARHKSLCLWVMDGNKRANIFYKRHGGQRCGKKTVAVGGKSLTEVAYGWRDTSVLIEGSSPAA